ncbi:hypothetical protein ANN_00292 [Periplaneta americana]|uniref:Uncharacterized protein n=1 Tax=Periplaneta americana TaxID=6978 RepID=A0ABQ8TQF6_PERAM|nr:hypothetical protein ANN_00292 [Periplaneta americana]
MPCPSQSLDLIFLIIMSSEEYNACSFALAKSLQNLKKIKKYREEGRSIFYKEEDDDDDDDDDDDNGGGKDDWRCGSRSEVVPWRLEMWGYVKERLYEVKNHDLHRLRTRIEEKYREKTADMSHRILNSMTFRLQTCPGTWRRSYRAHIIIYPMMRDLSNTL